MQAVRRVSSEVLVCASVGLPWPWPSMPVERSDRTDFWVGDLTKDEAEKLLELHGQEDRKDEFLDACPYAALFALFCRETHPALSGQPLNPLGGYKAMDLASTCQRYAKVGEEALQAKKADMDKKARKEVLRFKDQCKIAGDTGKEILEELLANRQAGKGADELCTPLHLRRMWRCGSASGVITP